MKTQNQAQNSEKNAIAFFSLPVFGKAWEIILDAVFPHKCVCGKWGVLLCPDCAADIRVDRTGLCPLCKRISEHGRTCQACSHRSYLTGVMILGPHKGILKNLIWRYKYEFIADLAEPLAELITARFGDFVREKRFIITYSPISRERLNWRGYNQAELLARAVSKSLNVECIKTLCKDNNVTPQVGHGRRERLRNIQGAIHFCGNPEFEKKKILIIDDVYTTGATLEECAKVLRQAGYREVWGLVLSRD